MVVFTPFSYKVSFSYSRFDYLIVLFRFLSFGHNTFIFYLTSSNQSFEVSCTLVSAAILRFAFTSASLSFDCLFDVFYGNHLAILRKRTQRVTREISKRLDLSQYNIQDIGLGF